MSARLLIAEDDAPFREMMRLALGKEGFRVRVVDSARTLAAAVEEEPFDLVISDIYLGDGTALDHLPRIRERNPGAGIILITAQGTVETVAAAQDAGVFDYLAKPFSLETLAGRVRAALAQTDKPVPPAAAGPETMIVGSSPAIVEVYKAVSRVAPLPVPVLLRGETGTGKELVARALHRFGADPRGPWVAVNCGAIPGELLESELFGHRKGAFTGAVGDRRGSIEEARGGTLFLDEIGELPAPLQVKLLRFLQDGEIRPVGAQESLHVPVRVVAATHRDLGRAAGEGIFREDLYYRLAAYEITLPPLRDRPQDVPLLVEHFLRKHGERFGLNDVSRPPPEVLELLQAHPWPGNVRQLENLVQRALVDFHGLGSAGAVRRLLPPAPEPTPPGIGDDLTLEELERRHIEAVLRRCDGNRSRAARILGIGRKSLYRKADRLGIALDPPPNPSRQEDPP